MYRINNAYFSGLRIKGRSGLISEEDELLLHVSFDFLWFNFQDIESDCLWEGSALSYSHYISFLDSESRGTVNGKVSVSLFESVILLNIVKIISSDDNCSLHLSRYDDSPIIIIIINKFGREKVKSSYLNYTYLKILPLMETSEVNGHFLSMYCPSIASVGVLKPI